MTDWISKYTGYVSQFKTPLIVKQLTSGGLHKQADKRFLALYREIDELRALIGSPKPHVKNKKQCMNIDRLLWGWHGHAAKDSSSAVLAALLLVLC